MKRVHLIISLLMLSAASGFLLVISQTEPARAGDGHPECNVNCPAYVWCEPNEAFCCGSQTPCPNAYKYFRSYAHWDDIECEGPRNCGIDDIGCGPNCSVPDPPPDTL